MHYLPPIVSKLGTIWLPICDSEIGILTNLMWLEVESVARRSLSRQLVAHAPTVLLWSISQMSNLIEEPETFFQRVGDWFADVGMQRIVAEGIDGGSCDHCDIAPASMGESVRRAIEIARFSSSSVDGAEPGGVAQKQSAMLLGMLCKTEEWLACHCDRTDVDRQQLMEVLLPTWLNEALQRVAGSNGQGCQPSDRVASAIRGLRDSELPLGSMTSAVSDEIPGMLDAFVAAQAKSCRLKQLEDDFQAALRREKLDAMKQLAYGASHEVNNPLANISTRAQSLLRDEGDPERRRKLATIDSQAYRAHEMIANLMLFAHPPTPVMESLELNSVVEEVIRELAESPLRQTATIQRSSPHATIEMQADRNHVAVMIKAICQNALEAIQNTGTIQVTTRIEASQTEIQRPVIDEDLGERETDEQVVVIECSDSGPGIPAEIQKHMFDPFYSGREAGRGLGFGLSKAWRIVQMHGGEIGIDSDGMHGTVVRVVLPVRAGHTQSGRSK